MLLKTKAFVFAGKNNSINRAMVYGLWSWGKFNNAETIQFSKTENEEYTRGTR
jgi:hypothetical protein